MVKETKDKEGGFIKASELLHLIDVDTLDVMAKQLATSPKLVFRTIRDILAQHGIYVSQIMELIVGDKAIEIFTHNLYIRLVPYKDGEWDAEVKILR